MLIDAPTPFVFSNGKLPQWITAEQEALMMACLMRTQADEACKWLRSKTIDSLQRTLRQ